MYKKQRNKYFENIFEKESPIKSNKYRSKYALDHTTTRASCHTTDDDDDDDGDNNDTNKNVT